ncbi:multi-sensor hybrid histidine kinase [Sulfurimonas gotlandica GD1]|uniref:histidine kinase n=1 Tax=Sulfurimonas gotlandica (strain DSM 19862 / JCM 16533 / GD1) TaxID=929558 RepID=B6BH31_SULGG|nr:ATP-binding protein [Sulfurimonas gotlandica]EDZ63839.1 sensory box sensor histidine kinase/response regulator [Sulfurimonas gotlandica GD1]EHP29820.1 multi-sensor hybrid histidine kinase [Sulfurimonas gotlandica GD1]
MKKYIIIVPIFLILLGVIIFYLVRWNEIKATTDKSATIKELSYELEIQNQKHKLLLSRVTLEVNYDAIIASGRSFRSALEKYTTILSRSNDEVLKKLAAKIVTKSKRLEYVYEDIKSDTALIKNSKMWLSKSYKKYLKDIKTSKEITPELMRYIFNIVNANNIYQLEELEPLDIDSKIFNQDKLRVHLNLLYAKRKSLIELNTELIENDIYIDLDEVTSYVNDVIEELKKETSSIVKALLMSTLFLIIFGLIVYVKEVLTRQEADNLKKELQQFVDALNESAVVSKSDTQGLITFVNDKFCEISGYSREELIGQGHNIIRHPDMPAELFKELWKTIRNKKIFKATIKNCKKSGEAYYVDSVIVPMLDVNNEIVEYLAVRYEVTELINSRDEALMAEKAKDEFLSNMSHELRTPLNAINGFSSLLKRQIKDEKQSKYIEHILESSSQLIGLINDILDLSKLQSGKFILDYHRFEPYSNIYSLVERFSPNIETASLNLVLDLDDSLKIVANGDWLRISQIITNLLSNAIKFTPAGGEVRLSANHNDDNLRIIVSDNGLGISKEVQEKIFMPFEQADSSTTRKFGGTGLGLSIVSNLLKQMDAQIKLESEDGNGSTFELNIPIKEYENKGESKSEKVASIQESKSILNGHILVAEDNITNQLLIGVLLDELGLTYKMANDGVEAVEMFGKEEYDLVLMDENMPKLSGVLAMNKIRSLYKTDVPIVSLTANVMSGDKEKFLRAGMDGYLAKPIDNNELYEVLQSFLSHKE